MTLPDAFFSPIYDLSQPHRLSQLRVAASRFSPLDPAVPELWEGPASTLLASTHAVVSDPRSAAAWSPVLYTPGAPPEPGHALAMSALVLDLAHVEPERAEGLRRRLLHRASLLHTTWEHGAHGEDDCCLQAVLLLSRPLRLDEATTLQALAQDQLGADVGPLDRPRPIPCCPRERLHLARIERNNGWLLDVDAALSTGSLPSPAVPR